LVPASDQLYTEVIRVIAEKNKFEFIYIMMRAPESVTLTIGAVMATVIVTLGALMLFTDYYPKIERPNRTYLAFIFLFYGAFRFYRSWNQYKRVQREKQREEWEEIKSKSARSFKPTGKK
jgi:hypothetical protein